MQELLERFSRDHWLTVKEYALLLCYPQHSFARSLADRVRRERFGTGVYLRGLIDVGSICEYDCPQCPQRSSASYTHYRMRPREILECCEDAWAMDVRSFVLRSGPDRFYTDKMLCSIVEKLQYRFPGCAVALAMGERSRECLEKLAVLGADRYMLLHETADRERFCRTHPPQLLHDSRLHCLNCLKDARFQTGCGFLVADQNPMELARELKFLEEFQPHWVELIPMGADPATVAYLISLIRLMLPDALICAPDNDPACILAGANMVTVNLIRTRRSFPCCGGYRADGPADPDSLAALRQKMADIGFEVLMSPDPWNA